MDINGWFWGYIMVHPILGNLHSEMTDQRCDSGFWGGPVFFSWDFHFDKSVNEPKLVNTLHIRHFCWFKDLRAFWCVESVFDFVWEINYSRLHEALQTCHFVLYWTIGFCYFTSTKAAISACEKASQWMVALEMFTTMPEQERNDRNDQND